MTPTSRDNRIAALDAGRTARWTRERARAAAPDGRRLVFEMSEDRPPNWREAIPVVLDELRKTKTPKE